MAEPNSPVLGLHLEGHYFNMAMAGGQIPENIKDPDPEEYIPLLEETSLYQTLGCRTGTSPEPCNLVNISQRKGCWLR